VARENKILGTMKDAKGRPLVILMRTRKGTLMHVFKRYKGMPDGDKATIMAVHSKLTGGVKASDDEMRDFLEFKDQLPCG
jgi:hypothetical protein